MSLAQINCFLKNPFDNELLPPNRPDMNSENLCLTNDCVCQCNVSSIAYPFDNKGYGKYTGIRYSCPNIQEPGCDPLDECARAHDICVSKYGYLNSCLCNIELIKCSENLLGEGFKPCRKMQEAKYIVIKYICDAIAYEPRIFGGCDNSSEIPNICLERTMYNK